MKFCWCTVHVKNMKESVRFYREIAGLPVVRRFAAGAGTEICFLSEGETKVELICRADSPVPAPAAGISLGFEVKSVDETVKFIKEKGLQVESGPFQPNPRIKFFFVKDPDGVSVQFVENM